jgi:hypothetical protein
MDEFTNAIGTILALAAGELRYPLQVSINAADGQSAIFLYPGEGETPACIDDHIGSDGIVALPLYVAVREWHSGTGTTGQRFIERVIRDSRSGELSVARTTKELIRELGEEAAPHAGSVAIVVAFENSTACIWSHDPDRQQVLDDAVRSGGKPVGLFAVIRKDSDKVEFATKVYPESAHLKWVDEYLRAVAIESGTAMVDEFGGKIERP